MGWGSTGKRALASAFPFVFLFGLIAILARATAVETPAPWFDPGITQTVYAVTLAAGVFVTVGVAIWATHRRSALDDAIRTLDLRLSVIRAALADDELDVPLESGRGGGTAPKPATDHPAMAAGTMQGQSLRIDVPLVSITDTREGALSKKALEAEAAGLAATRTAQVAARDWVLPSLVGPMGVGILYATIAGTLLPGSGGFLTANFRLNTMFILFIGYSWWLLLTWLVFALATQGRSLRRAAKGPAQA